MLVNANHTGDVESIKTTDDRHKYSSAMAEYLDLKGADFEDRSSGDVECPTDYFAQFGKRILFSDDRGFVWVEKWPSEQSAEQVFDALDRYYDEWSDEESDTSEAARMMNLVELDAFLFYVGSCARENLEAFSFDAWQVNGKPTGPLS